MKAFTLIELLTVIAIIGALAAILVGISPAVTTQSRVSRMRAEHQRLLTAIQAYKDEVGNFPPDNPDNRTSNATNRYRSAGKNALFYELSGAIFRNDNGGEFTVQNKSETVRAADLKTYLNVKGIENSARNRKDIPYRGISFKPSQYAELDTPANVDVELLVTPLPGPHDKDFARKNSPLGMNPWFYDTSSSNRHNIESFDLWSEYKIGNDVRVIGNWNE